MAQAIKLSEVANGEFASWNFYTGTGTNLEFNKQFVEKYIFPYLNNPELCGYGNETNISQKCGGGVSSSDVRYFLPNGSTVALSTANGQFYVMFDVNGKKAPSRLGTDRFYFIANDKGLKPYGADTTQNREAIINGTATDSTGNIFACKASPNPDNPNELYRHGCTLLLFMDGWEFADDYPFD